MNESHSSPRVDGLRSFPEGASRVSRATYLTTPLGPLQWVANCQRVVNLALLRNEK
jgi:hypothetical protein